MNEDTPLLPGMEATPSKGHYFAKIAVDALDHLPKGVTRDVFAALMRIYRPGRPIRATNERIAELAGCHEGTARRAIRYLKDAMVPGCDYPFIVVGGNNADRVIWVLCRPIEAGEDASYKQVGARAGAQGGRAPAPTPLDASASGETTCEMPLFLDLIKDRSNVNVGISTDEILTHARVSEPTSPVEDLPPPPSPERVAPEPPAPPPQTSSAVVQTTGVTSDGINAELVGLGPGQLRERIAALEARRKALEGTPNSALRMKLWCQEAEARAVLEALEGTGDPVPTPAMAPRPAAPPPPPPAPKPTIEGLLGRLARVAGTAPVEDYARFVADQLRDGHSLPMHRQIAKKIQSGEIPRDRALAGYRMARSGTARVPGSVYVNYVNQRE